MFLGATILWLWLWLLSRSPLSKASHHEYLRFLNASIVSSKHFIHLSCPQVPSTQVSLARRLDAVQEELEFWFHFLHCDSLLRYVYLKVRLGHTRWQRHFIKSLISLALFSDIGWRKQGLVQPFVMMSFVSFVFICDDALKSWRWRT